MPTAMRSTIPADGSWYLDGALNWGSSAIVQTAADEALIVDAETRELRLTIGRAVTDRWAIQLQLPYRYTGAGTLDSFIDSWHDVFGLPEGERPNLPQDRFRIAYEREDIAAFDYAESGEGLGDLSLDLGHQWVSTPYSSLAAWLSVKLPTGNSSDLNGSGATDVALTMAGERRVAGTWSAFGQFSITALGNGDLLPAQQRDFVVNGLAGIGAQVWRGLELKVQFDGRTAAFDDTQLDYLGDSLILTVGGTWRFQSGWQLDIGVSEDIVIDASPDVVFVLGLRRR